jgi:hypothetical protein
VWAYAALAFEVLTGELPFAADTVAKALLVAEGDRVPAPSAYVPSLSPDVDAALGEALAVDPAYRPRDLATLATGLLDSLGDEARGREALRGLVGELAAEEEEREEFSLGRLGLWDRLAARSGLGTRIFVGAESAYLAWAGMSPLRFGWPASAAAAAIAAVAGFFAPAIGLAAALVVLAAGAFAVSLPAGAAVAAVVALWWAAVGRTHPAAAAVPVFAPLAAIARLPFAVPVLAGFFLEGLWPAAAAGAGAGGAMVAVSALPGTATSLAAASLGARFTGAWYLQSALLVVGFAAAAVLSSLGARRATRLGAAAGALVGLAAIAVAQVPWLTGGSQPTPATLLQLLLASILVGVVIALGPPVRSDPANEPATEEEGA